MKRVLLRSLNEKGVMGLKKLNPKKKGIKVKVYLETPYTKELILTNKKMQKQISERDIESLLYAFPHIIGCSLRNNKDYTIEVLE